VGFRFRKIFSLGKFFRINIGKQGVSSVGIGPRGTSLSVGKQGVHANVGLRGTGLSYRKKIADPPRRNKTVVKAEEFGEILTAVFQHECLQRGYDLEGEATPEILQLHEDIGNAEYDGLSDESREYLAELIGGRRLST